MKICFIGASVGSVNASMETLFYQMARNLSKRHDVTLITGKSRKIPLQKRIEEAEFEVAKVPFWHRNSPLNRFFMQFSKRFDPWKIESYSMYYNVLLRPRIKRIIKESDVIIPYYRLDIRLFSNLAHKYGVPCVSYVQFTGLGKKFFQKDKSKIYVANSKFSKDALEQKYQIKIHGVVTPGISWEFFDENHPKIPEVKSHKSLLFVGDIRPKKGIFELFEIFKKISIMHPESMLYIIGSGVSKDALIKKIQEANLSERIKILGTIDYKDMPSYYHSASVLVHPTYIETFGMVILEALASGLPVVATDLPPLREVSGGNAVLLPLDDLNVWVEKIDLLLKAEKSNEKKIKMGREEAKKHIWEEKAKELEIYLVKASEFKGKL